MAGYAKSVVFPASSTLPELVVAAFGGSHPELAYKLYVLLARRGLSLADRRRLSRPRASAAGRRRSPSLLSLVYIWTDWPINYVTFGMLPYFLGVPVALVATSALRAVPGDATARVRGSSATALLSLAVLVHLTTAMVIAPGGAARLRRRRSVAEVPVAAIDLATHAAVWLDARSSCWPSMRSGGARVCSWRRPRAIAASRSRIRRERDRAAGADPLDRGADPGDPAGRGAARALAAGPPLAGRRGGARRDSPRRAWPGATWPAPSASLDFLQPGRHTFALYSGLAIAGGRGARGGRSGDSADGAVGRPRSLGHRRDARDRHPALRPHAGGVGPRPPPGRRAVPVEPALAPVALGRRSRRAGTSSRASGCSTRRAARTCPATPDPFQRGRFSGLLPHRTGRRAARRPVPACRADDQLHPVRRGEAVRPGGLGPRFLRPVCPALPAVGHPLLEPACAGVLPGEPRPDPHPGGRRAG